MKTRNARVTFFVLFALLGIAATAWACVPGGAITGVTPTSGPPGTQVTVTGNGVHEGEPVRLRWNGMEGPVIGESAGAPDGGFSISGTIPSDSAGGVGYIMIVADFGGVARATFEVLSAGAPVNSGLQQLQVEIAGKPAAAPAAAPAAEQKAAPPPEAQAPPPPAARPLINAWEDGPVPKQKGSWLDSSLQAFKKGIPQLFSRPYSPLALATFALALVLFGFFLLRPGLAGVSRIKRRRKFR